MRLRGAEINTISTRFSACTVAEEIKHRAASGYLAFGSVLTLMSKHTSS